MESEEMIAPPAPTAELERLLHGVARGDTDALSELYGRTHAAVYALALSMTGNTQQAEDLTHDAYLRIWDYAGSYRAKGKPMAWILAVTRNLCFMELRKNKRRADLTEEQWDAIPADARVSEDDRAALQTALSGLRSDERQVVLLHATSGLKHREIAKLLDMPLGTVLSKYRRAIEKLRETMKGE